MEISNGEAQHDESIPPSSVVAKILRFALLLFYRYLYSARHLIDSSVSDGALSPEESDDRSMDKNKLGTKILYQFTLDAAGWVYRREVVSDGPSWNVQLREHFR